MEDSTILNPNQVKLSDGRVVTLRETTGSDEIAAAAMLGSHFTQDASGAALYTKALAHRAIVDIDGVAVTKGPIKFKDFNAFWKDIKTRDSGKLMVKYQEMNSDSDEEGNGNGPLDEE